MSLERKKISIYGASGHSKVIIEIINSIEFELTTIFDDDPNIQSVMGYPVKLVKDQDKATPPLIIAVGNNGIRKKIAAKWREKFSGFIAHPSAVISPSSAIGKGTVIMANATINASARIGEHAIINTGCIVEHDCSLSDYVHISPNATLAGGVEIGEGTHIGTGASILPGIKIGSWCTIGAGTVVIENIPDGVTVVGNPGRILDR